MINKHDKQRLKTLLFQKSCKNGNFLLTSGKKSNFYVNCMAVTLSPEGSYLCGKLLYNTIKRCKPDAIGGIELGAAPLITATTVYSHTVKNGLHGLIVRKIKKDHGTSVNIEGTENLDEGATVAVVEDVVTTGGSLLQAIKQIEFMKYKVVTVVTLINRQEGGSEMLFNEGYKLESLFNKTDFV